MGLFDYLGEKIQQAGNTVQEAQMEAENWSASKICYRLKNESSMTKCTGYAKALRGMCKEMSDWELKEIFDEAYNQRNAKACNAMLAIMDDRGLAYKDENGRFVRTYR